MQQRRDVLHPAGCRERTLELLQSDCRRLTLAASDATACAHASGCQRRVRAPRAAHGARSTARAVNAPSSHRSDGARGGRSLPSVLLPKPHCRETAAPAAGAMAARQPHDARGEQMQRTGAVCCVNAPRMPAAGAERALTDCSGRQTCAKERRRGQNGQISPRQLRSHLSKPNVTGRYGAATVCTGSISTVLCSVFVNARSSTTWFCYTLRTDNKANGCWLARASQSVH